MKKSLTILALTISVAFMERAGTPRVSSNGVTTPMPTIVRLDSRLDQILPADAAL
jgi:hypothetical protein